MTVPIHVPGMDRVLPPLIIGMDGVSPSLTSRSQYCITPTLRF